MTTYYEFLIIKNRRFSYYFQQFIPP